MAAPPGMTESKTMPATAVAWPTTGRLWSVVGADEYLKIRTVGS